MPPVSILMLLFSAALLIYAGLLAITKDYNLLPYRASLAVKPKNSKAYTFQLSKVIALVALVPALAGLIGAWSPMLGVIAGIASFVYVLWLGTKIMKKVD